MKRVIFFILIISGCTNRSTDKAQQLLSPVLLSDSTKQATCVFLSSDEKDLPVISWCEVDRRSGRKSFYLSFFDEDNKSFSRRTAIPIEQEASLHEEGMPKVAIKADGTIIAVYETPAPTNSNGYAGFVHYIVSADKGKTWTAPACLHADTVSGKSRSFAVITRLDDGEVGACWLDESLDRKAGGRPVRFAKTDRENRFTGELIIDSIACQCCRIAMSSRAKGKIAVAFRDIINDSIRDMSLSTSGDNGKTFTPARPFSGDGWAINGCPHNGPSIASGGDHVYATWFTGGRQTGVYYCEMDNNGKPVNKQLVSGRGRFIQLCLLRDGTPVLAYNENVHEGGHIYSRIVLNKMQHGKVFGADVSTGKTMASYPVLRSFGNDDILVAWKEDDKVCYAVTSAGDINAEITRPAVSEVAAAKDLSHVKLASTTDLVCGMPLSLSPGDTALFREHVYGFCSEICKKQFLQNPQLFVSRLKSRH